VSDNIKGNSFMSVYLTVCRSF